jgi:nucleoid-associated protein YgaU
MGRSLGRITLVLAGFVALLLPARAGAPSRPVRIPVTVAQPPAADIVVVERGDHLWKISARHLNSSMGRPPESYEVSPYWREVIEVNRDSLRSGDPDLIYPGEIVTLPSPAFNERR